MVVPASAQYDLGSVAKSIDNEPDQEIRYVPVKQ